MATADIILFSPPKLSNRDIVHALGPALRDCELELVQVSRLGWDRAEGLFQSIGEELPCFEESEALEIAAHWDGFVLAYDNASSLQRLYFYHWKNTVGSYVSVQVSPQFLTFDSPEWPEGRWFRTFVCTATAAMQLDAASYGFPYNDFLKSVEVQTVIEWLRNGQLQRLTGSSIHLIAADFITSDEIRKLLTPGKKIHYSIMTSGYHVLSNLPDDKRG